MDYETMVAINLAEFSKGRLIGCLKNAASGTDDGNDRQVISAAVDELIEAAVTEVLSRLTRAGITIPPPPPTEEDY
jgi:hypothetical protein